MGKMCGEIAKDRPRSEVGLKAKLILQTVQERLTLDFTLRGIDPLGENARGCVVVQVLSGSRLLLCVRMGCPLQTRTPTSFRTLDTFS